jgi:hypothetical protein
VQSGYCIRDVADALDSGSDVRARISAARALAFIPFRRRLEILALLEKAAAEHDSVAVAARETLHQLDGADRR